MIDNYNLVSQVILVNIFYLLYTIGGLANSSTPSVFLASTIFVDSSATTGNNNGTSWSDAFLKLQDALQIAQSGDIIQVAKGTYFPDEGVGISDNDRTMSFIIPDSTQLLGGYPNGGGTRDLSVNRTILSGDIGIVADSTDNSYHVVTIMNVTAATLLDGFEIILGNANGDGTNKNGGGLYHVASIASDTSAPVISNCMFTNNAAETRGGAVFNGAEVDGSHNSPFFIHCLFANNYCSFDGGAMFNIAANSGMCYPSIDSCTFQNNSANAAGAVHVLASINGDCSPTITNSIFMGNEATTNGGAVHTVIFEGNSSPAIDNCSFDNNFAGWSGGAVYHYAAIAGYTISTSIDSCIFHDNVASTVDGGAIDNWAENGMITGEVTNSRFLRNSADNSSGGGIMNYAAQSTGINTIAVWNCVFEANTAAYGGAINNFAWQGTCEPSIIQCLLYNDTAVYSGAIDIFADQGISSPFLLNNTITQNYSESNAAVGIEAITGTASPMILNHIIAQNYDTIGTADISAFNATAFIDYSIVDTLNCLGLGDGITCGANVLFDKDPKFQDPKNHNFHLKAGSPAIDMGSNDSVIALNLTLDLAGQQRIFNDSVDMGVYETDGMPSFCEDTIELLDVTIPDVLYHANKKVIANGQVNGNDLTLMKASDCLDFLGGFQVDHGSPLEIDIDDCLLFVVEKSSYSQSIKRHKLKTKRALSELNRIDNNQRRRKHMTNQYGQH